MTDNEKDKALEYIDELRDLINRYEAEIEQLAKFKDYKAHIRVEDMIVCADSLGEWLEFLDGTKAEARKEFAERLKKGFKDLEFQAETERKTIRIEELQAQMDWVLHSVAIETIDDTVKEMVGESV